MESEGKVNPQGYPDYKNIYITIDELVWLGLFVN